VSNPGRDPKTRLLKLTPGQARYVQHRLAGDKPQAAYAKAFPGASKTALKCKPYMLERNKRVVEAMDAAQKGDAKTVRKLTERDDTVAVVAAGAVAREVLEVGMTRAEKRRVLKRLAMNPKLPAIDRIRAIQVDNLMTGDNKPVRFEGEITLHGIFQALGSTTGLPDPNEVFELEPATGVAPP
jgi:hypothetical protein